jgi:hypothetical protein
MEADNQLPVMIRVAELSDIPFIFNSWLKSYRDSPAVKNVPNTVYYAEHHKVIEEVLASKSLMILVACNKEDQDQICGYIVAELTPELSVIHWLYCKHTFRKLGIAKLLESSLMNMSLSGSTHIYTHMSKSSDKLAKLKTYIYNPYKQRGIK